MTDPRFNAFYMLTGGVTFVAFGASFWPCLFDISQVRDCVAVSEHYVDIFRSMGDHVIQWAIALAHAAFHA